MSVVTLAPLLHDPVRAVRLEAAEVLARTPPDAVPSGVASELNNAVDEYVASQELNADRPEAQLNLGLLYAKEHDLAKAESELKITLSLDPAFAPAAVKPRRPLSRRTGIQRVSTSSMTPSVVHQMMRRFNTRSVC